MNFETTSFKVTVLGCGTSSGVPFIGCKCPVCTSKDPHNHRLRAGLRLEIGDHVILIDTPTDLRQQALRFATRRVDAVLFTHAHADHIFGLDDLRAFNFLQGTSIPCYGSSETLTRIRKTFAYIFEAGQKGGGKPQIELCPVTGRFQLLGVEILPIPVWHGSLMVLGYRIGSFAYVTDCNAIPEDSLRQLGGVTTLILGALRYAPHPTHFSIGESIEIATRIGARETYFTHLNHDVDYTAPMFPLPEKMAFAHDGLCLQIS